MFGIPGGAHLLSAKMNTNCCAGIALSSLVLVCLGNMEIRHLVLFEGGKENEMPMPLLAWLHHPRPLLLFLFLRQASIW